MHILSQFHFSSLDRYLLHSLAYLVVSFRSPYLFYLLTVGVEVVLFSLDHTQTHTTFGRTPQDEGSARRRDLYVTTHKHSQGTNIHAPGGIRTHDPKKRSAADLRLRPRGHWDRLFGGHYPKTFTILATFNCSPCPKYF
jgi:hypothetical protein